jgi:hypothetical protein
MMDLPTPSYYEYTYHRDDHNDRLQRRLKLYKTVIAFYAEHYQLCECEGDSDRDQDRAGYGRYGGTTDFDHHDFEQHRQSHIQRSWEHTKQAGVNIMQGMGNSLAGREDEAIENFALAAKELGEAFMEKWTADSYGETLTDFYTED